MTTRSFLALAGAMILVPACGPARPSEKTPEELLRDKYRIGYDLSRQAEVEVTVENGMIKIPPGWNPIVLQERESNPGYRNAHWHLTASLKGDLEIQMKAETPFIDRPQHAGKGHVVSYPPRNGSGGTGEEKYRKYGYTIIVRLDEGPSPPPLDPDIRVDR